MAAENENSDKVLSRGGKSVQVFAEQGDDGTYELSLRAGDSSPVDGRSADGRRDDHAMSPRSEEIEASTYSAQGRAWWKTALPIAVVAFAGVMFLLLGGGDDEEDVGLTDSTSTSSDSADFRGYVVSPSARDDESGDENSGRGVAGVVYDEDRRDGDESDDDRVDTRERGETPAASPRSPSAAELPESNRPAAQDRRNLESPARSQRIRQVPTLEADTVRRMQAVPVQQFQLDDENVYDLDEDYEEVEQYEPSLEHNYDSFDEDLDDDW